MIGFDEALALLSAVAAPLGRETVPMAEAAGRLLAEPVVAEIDSPSRDCSAMDGYAVRDADLDAPSVGLVVAGEAFPGQSFAGRLAPGQAVRIFTGAPVPEGADRVVIQEHVGREGELAILTADRDEGRHIRRRGSDFMRGEILVPAGRCLDARALVAAAAGDTASVEAWRKPRVALIATGDELVEPGTARARPGMIPESVSLGIAAFLEQWGTAMCARVRLGDDLRVLEKAAADLLAEADLVVVTGGASVGERDYAKAMFAPSGLELVFSKVAIKPGKPVWLGRAAGKPVIGLPGNPSSALVTARLFLAPLLLGLGGGGTNEALHWQRIALGDDLPPCGPRETFVRARRDGVHALPLSSQDSSVQKMLVDADLLIRRRPNAPAARAGDDVDVLHF